MRKELQEQLSKLPPPLNTMPVTELTEWVGDEHHMRAELFFSMFHKKWSINSYFINTKKFKKVYPKEDIKEMFLDYREAREIALSEMLKLI